MNSRGSIDLDNIAKPSSTIKFSTVKEYMSKSSPIVSEKQTTPNINLLEFSRMYEICEIPIINFVIVYIILYFLNCLYFDYDFKIILIATIPITLIFSIVSSPKLKLSLSMIIISVISIILVIVLFTVDLD